MFLTWKNTTSISSITDYTHKYDPTLQLLKSHLDKKKKKFFPKESFYHYQTLLESCGKKTKFPDFMGFFLLKFFLGSASQLETHILFFVQ